ncbi:MAG: putative peptidoglycan glycosyltransferase FtsW [Luteolibacter sp.]|uniref:FtsW/RodA/SpoVE family cell cycle protein n=1 Tax=Luteolibacter sp. TaxID=1962973 RepID=UPI003265AE94
MTRHCSVLLCTAVAALVALGLIMLTSTGAWVPGFSAYHFMTAQAAWVGVGLVCALVAARFPLETLRKFAPWMLAAACVMLILCYVPGISDARWGSKRWIKVPVIGSFQPSEAAKIVIVLALSAWFARWQTEVRTFWRGFVMPGIIAGIPILLIAGETDVGTALSLCVAVGAIMFCIGTRLIYAVPTALLGMSGAVWFIMHDVVRRTRIDVWMDLANHQRDQGMQQWRGLLALGNGGPWGVGLGNGVEKFGTLTFAYTDFIFPVIGEELGLPFTLGAVVCYVLIAVCGCGIALQANNIFNRCVALGLTCVIVVPAMQNIAVTTAMLPNDGLPLPFVSYGGTSLVFSLAAVGMLVGIHRRSYARVSQEFPLTKQTRLAVRL